MQHLVKVKHLLSVRAFRQLLKLLQPETDAITGPAFTVFPNLPLELQRKIWEFAAITHPRAIEVHSRYRGNRNKRVASFYSYYRIEPSHRYYTTTSPIPTSLLHTCSESRKIAFGRYSFHFLLGRPFYFDNLRDILWMKSDAKFDAVTLLIGEYTTVVDSKYKECCTSAMIEKHGFRFLALSYQSWVRSPMVRQRYCEYTGIWDQYALGGTTVEKIFLVYTEEDQRNEAMEDAKALHDHGKIKMEFYSRLVINSSEIARQSYKNLQLRRKYGRGFDVPPVEAILDTDLKLLQ